MRGKGGWGLIELWLFVLVIRENCGNIGYRSCVLNSFQVSIKN